LKEASLAFKRLRHGINEIASLPMNRQQTELLKDSRKERRWFIGDLFQSRVERGGAIDVDDPPTMLPSVSMSRAA